MERAAFVSFLMLGGLFPCMETRAEESANELKQRGTAYFEQGFHLEAARMFAKADRIDSLDERSRFMLATAYVALDRRHWARPQFEKLAREHPSDPRYPYWLARIYYFYNWFEEAIVELQDAIAIDPDFVQAHDRLGLCLEGLGRPQEAIAEYEKAVWLSENAETRSPWPYYHLGSLLRQQGQFARAEKHLRRALAAGPELSAVHYELGVVLDKLGKSRQAVEFLERAAELDPSDPKSHYALARVYRRLDNKEKVVEEIQKFRKLSNQ